MDAIHADLTARRGGAGVDLTGAQRLYRNMGVAFMGDTKGGPFDVRGEQARGWLRAPANPNGKPNSDVLRPWMNGMDVTRRPADKWIVDFGWDMVREEAALYEAPYRHAQEHVYPMRQRNRRESYRERWWRHVEPRQGMWRALAGLSRYIATPTVAKHRLFVWLDAGICPDHQLIVIARDDDTTFGILHSRFHEAWSLRLGTWLGKGNDPRYTPTTTFETFPFPEGLSPDLPAAGDAGGPRARRHRRGGAAAGHIAGPLAEPARVGGVGGGAGPRLSEAPGRPRRSGGEGAQGPHPHEPLQRPPAVARRRPCGPRRCRRACLWLAGGRHGRGCAAGTSGAERRGVPRLCDEEASWKPPALNVGREIRRT